MLDSSLVKTSMYKTRIIHAKKIAEPTVLTRPAHGSIRSRAHMPYRLKTYAKKAQEAGPQKCLGDASDIHLSSHLMDHRVLLLHFNKIQKLVQEKNNHSSKF